MQVAARVESAKEKEETEGMVQEERKHQIEVSHEVFLAAIPRGDWIRRFTSSFIPDFADPKIPRHASCE